MSGTTKPRAELNRLHRAAVRRSRERRQEKAPNAGLYEYVTVTWQDRRSSPVPLGLTAQEGSVKVTTASRIVALRGSRSEPMAWHRAVISPRGVAVTVCGRTWRPGSWIEGGGEGDRCKVCFS